MPRYKAPVADTMFLLTDVFGLHGYENLPRFADAQIDVVEAVLSEGGKLAEEVLQPLNLSGDQEGCKRLPDGSVVTPTGFREAYRTYVEGGWVGIAGSPAYGGQGLPHFLSVALNEYALAANLAFTMYPALTKGATDALLAHGNDALKSRFLPKMTTGEWTGTMNLTEPHCGTDLGLIKTRALRHGDGSFAISGQKIFISAGERDLAENIIHLVLARIEGAPAGVKGISLFLVPKVLVNDDGSLAERNTVSCGSIEHKMGIRGNSTCVMNYDSATGWLDRRGKSWAQCDVRDDEQRPPRCRRARSGAIRGRLSERGRLRQGSPAGPVADRRQGARQARRSHPGASRRPSHAARNPRLQRGCARLDDLGRARPSTLRTNPLTLPPARPPTTVLAYSLPS